MIRYSDCDALKSAASFSSCRPSSPDIACHHMISVTAWAGDEKVNAAAAAASCKNLKADFTIKPFCFAALDARLRAIGLIKTPSLLETQSLLKTQSPRFQSAKRRSQRTMD